MQIKMIKGIGDIVNHYDAFILDLVGVIHNGKVLFPLVLSCLQALEDKGKQIYFLSNMPRPGDTTIEMVGKMGLEIESDKILTSGDAVRHQLVHREDKIFKNLGHKFYQLGAEKNKDILKGLDVHVVSNMEDADFILLTYFADPDEGDDVRDVELKKGIELGLPMVCTNPDIFAMHGGHIRRTAGFFAKRYEDMGGTVHYYGKPHSPIYAMIFQDLGKAGITDLKRVVMVGDTLEMDILGAYNAGIESVLTLSGNTGHELQGNADLQFLEKFCQEKELPMPTWVVDEFRY